MTTTTTMPPPALEYQTTSDRINLHARFQQSGIGYSWHKSRAYVSISESEVPEPRPDYGSLRGDGSDEDKAWRRYNRLEIIAMRRKLMSVIDALNATCATVIIGSSGWKFSRKAGCGCGCSPGFIFGDDIRVPDDLGRSRPIDLWVS